MKAIIVSIMRIGDITYIGLSKKVPARTAKEILILLDDEIQIKRWKFTKKVNEKPEKLYIYDMEKNELKEIKP